LCITVAWFAALLISNIFVIQEKNNLDRLYGSVSVRLKDIVLGRYVFMLLNFFASLVMAIIISFAFALYQNEKMQLIDILFGFSFSLFVYSAITGIQIPLFFKIGYTKAKAWTTITLAAVIAAVYIPLLVPALSFVIESIQSNRGIMIICSLTASCVIQFISYKTSVLFYRKRKRG
jgi:uncharacterized membrane protein